MNTPTTRSPVVQTTTEAANATRTFQTKPNLYDFHIVLTHVLLIGIMFCVSCGLNKQLIMPQLKRPIKLVLGMVCQFILFPLVTFGIMMAVDFPDNLKVGAIITASSSSGVYSNVWTMWSRGDMALSVIMTAVSSTLVLIFMPLNVSVYTLPWVSDGHVIPFSALAIASAETWLAVGAGVACHYHFPEFAHKAVTNGTMLFFVFYIFDSIFLNICYPNLFSLGPAIILTVFALPFVGFLVSMLVSAPFYRWLNVHQMKTIGFQTGTQNMAPVFQLINLTYNKTPQTLLQYSAFAIIFSPAQLVDFALVARFSYMYFACKAGEHPCQKHCCKCCEPHNQRNQITPDLKPDEKHGTDIVELEGGEIVTRDTDDVKTEEPPQYVDDSVTLNGHTKEH